MPFGTPLQSRFLVKPRDSFGWLVAIEGWNQSHVFTDKRLAVQYAHDWADVNRPSEVALLDKDGKVETRWSFAAR